MSLSRIVNLKNAEISFDKNFFTRKSFGNPMSRDVFNEISSYLSYTDLVNLFRTCKQIKLDFMQHHFSEKMHELSLEFTESKPSRLSAFFAKPLVIFCFVAIPAGAACYALKSFDSTIKQDLSYWQGPGSGMGANIGLSIIGAGLTSFFGSLFFAQKNHESVADLKTKRLAVQEKANITPAARQV